MPIASLLVLLLLNVGSVAPTSAGPAQPPSETERSRTRDAWQRPEDVFDGLAIKANSRVADVGSGSGYFSLRLAERVGRGGRVYAVDVNVESLQQLRTRAEREGLTQLETIHGASNDPHLPDGLDAVLIVDAYHEFRDYDAMLQAIRRALVPGGRLVIIDGDGPAGRPRTDYHRLHRLPSALVREEAVANGFVFKGERPGFTDRAYDKQMYFLVFEKPQARSSS